MSVRKNNILAMAFIPLNEFFMGFHPGIAKCVNNFLLSHYQFVLVYASINDLE